MEWYVYVNEIYVGTVYESAEEFARCAALSKYDVKVDDALHVVEVRQ